MHFTAGERSSHIKDLDGKSRQRRLGPWASLPEGAILSLQQRVVAAVLHPPARMRWRGIGAIEAQVIDFDPTLSNDITSTLRFRVVA